jgi:diaminopimelate epimerase
VQLVKDIKDFEVVSEGKAIRYNERFKADGINVNFIELLTIIGKSFVIVL